VKFYYARVVVNDFVSRKKELEVKYTYEIYNSIQNKDALNKLVFGKSENSQNWYEHLTVNKAKYSKQIKLSTISQTSKLKISDNKIQLLDLEKGNNEDFGILVKPPKELVYNRFDENASLTTFNVEFEIPTKENVIKEIKKRLPRIKAKDTTDININRNTRVSW